VVAETKYGGGRVELLMMDDVFLKPNGGLSNAQQKKIPLFFSFFYFFLHFSLLAFSKVLERDVSGDLQKGEMSGSQKRRKKNWYKCVIVYERKAWNWKHFVFTRRPRARRI